MHRLQSQTSWPWSWQPAGCGIDPGSIRRGQGRSFVVASVAGGLACGCQQITAQGEPPSMLGHAPCIHTLPPADLRRVSDGREQCHPRAAAPATSVAVTSRSRHQSAGERDSRQLVPWPRSRPADRGTSWPRQRTSTPSGCSTRVTRDLFERGRQRTVVPAADGQRGRWQILALSLVGALLMTAGDPWYLPTSGHKQGYLQIVVVAVAGKEQGYG